MRRGLATVSTRRARFEVGAGLGQVTRANRRSWRLVARRYSSMTMTRPLQRLATPVTTALHGRSSAAAVRTPFAVAGGRVGAYMYRGFASEPDIATVSMPALSPTMQHGTISEWHKKPGEVCKPGDVLCEIETDKATIAFEVTDEYVLAKVLVDAKAHEVKVGDPVALSVEDEEAYKAFAELEKSGKLKLGTQTQAASTPAPAPSASAPTPPPAPVAEQQPSDTLSKLGDFAISPAARHILLSKGLDWRSMSGTGKLGRITKGDVMVAIARGELKPAAKHHEAAVPAPSPAASHQAEAAAQPRAPAPAPPSSPASQPPSTAQPQMQVEIPQISAAPGTFKDTPNSNMRKIIARRLAESKATVPHSYETVECELDSALALRKTLQKEYEVNFSVNDLIIRSAALALRDVPEANAFWDVKKGTATTSPNVDISVAVATPSGLITPIIPRSDQLGLTEISAKMKDLAGRAKANKLKPQEFQGGTFTISNLGMFGIDEFSAVINPPQGAIMAVGRGSKRVRVPPYKEGQDLKEVKPYVATIMIATLSFDRRVLDDAIAAHFLQTFKAYMSRPELLLL